MALAEKLFWYGHRLAAMSPPEIAWRVLEAARRRGDNIRAAARLPPPADQGALPPIPGLREGLAALETPPPLLREWEECAGQAQTGHYFLLGQKWPGETNGAKWHLDPVTGKTWPAARYCFDIDFRHAGPRGDIKYVWELNRLQCLQSVAALACKRGDETLAKFCLAELDGWIGANPPYLGVNWASGIELGLRVVSIFVVVTLLGEYLAEAPRARIWGTLIAHGRWLARYPSRFTSANNHRTAEGLGLFLIGALCPQLPEAPRWKTEGWKALADAARLQILPDGVGAEQTITYTAAVLEMLMLGLVVARAVGMDIPPAYPERIALAGEYLRWFTDAAGNQPRIGDDDNARVLGSYRPDETHARSVLASVAAMTGRADLAPPDTRPHLRDALFGVPPAPAPGPTGVRVFERGGYTVGRHMARIDKEGSREILLAMDHGYLGYLSIAAHGHADALAIWLHIGGQPVLVDAGTYLYHAGGPWRAHFRGTAAHNTLALAGRDSSTMSGNFNWSRKANATLVSREIGAAGWQIVGEHDGYRRDFGVTHFRRLAVIPGIGFTVEDRLAGKGAQDAAIGFLLHPALTPVAEEGAIRIRQGDETLLTLRHKGPLAPRIDAAGTPAGGWYSPGFGLKEPATRIVFAGRLAPDQAALTHFAFGSGQ